MLALKTYQELKFFPKTNQNPVGFVSDVYKMCIDERHFLFEENESTIKLLEGYPFPTHFELMTNAFYFFPEVYYDYIHSEHNKGIFSPDPTKTKDDYMEMLYDQQSNDASYRVFLDEDAAKDFFHDIELVLQQHNFNYLKDDITDIFAHTPSINLIDWINEPVRRVW